MRYVEFKVRSGDRWFHPVDERIAAEPGMRHGPIHHVDMLDDGTVVLLYEILGSRERIEELLDEQGRAIATETEAVGDDTLVYTHIEPTETVRSLLEVVEGTRVILDTPITFSDDDELEVRLVGDGAAIQEAFTAAPEDVQVSVEKTGEYRLGRERLFVELTERQQEILATALEMGYYDEPRGTTYADIAAELDLTATTVGEHLRKIERYVLRAITPENDRRPPERSARN